MIGALLVLAGAVLLGALLNAVLPPAAPQRAKFSSLDYLTLSNSDMVPTSEIFSEVRRIMKPRLRLRVVKRPDGTREVVEEPELSSGMSFLIGGFTIMLTWRALLEPAKKATQAP